MTPESTTTWKRWRREPLVLALGVSILLHGTFWGVWRVGDRHGWWEVSVPWLDRLLASLQAVVVDPEEVAEALARQQQRAAEEVPLMFMDVSAAQASTEAPENAKFYGALNSVAANTKAAEQEGEMPEIDGDQTDVLKAMDVPENQIQPAISPQMAENKTEQAVVDPASAAPETQPEEIAAGLPDVPEVAVAEKEATKPGTPDQIQVPQPLTPKPGDLAMAPTRTQPERGDGAPPRGEQGSAPAPRPRTIAQARALQQETLSIAGERAKVEGGVSNQRVVPSFDTQGTPWGSYDAKFVATIQSQWYRFLDLNPGAYNQTGKVVTKFILHHDGRITDFEITENSSGELQGYGCQKAILRDLGQPYDPWPPQLLRITDKKYRELSFTFYYH